MFATQLYVMARYETFDADFQWNMKMPHPNLIAFFIPTATYCAYSMSMLYTRSILAINEKEKYTRVRSSFDKSVGKLKQFHVIAFLSFRLM